LMRVVHFLCCFPDHCPHVCRMIAAKLIDRVADIQRAGAGNGQAGASPTCPR
jgi:hypothetical protein